MCLQTNSMPMTIHSTSPRSLASIYNSTTKDEILSIIPSSPVFGQEASQVQPRRVSFSNDEVVGAPTQSSIIQMQEQQHSSTWYLPHELQVFKAEVRFASQAIRDKQRLSGNTAASSVYNTVEYPTRGLEQRICKNRQRNKALAIWGTLKAQQRNNDPEFIAMIARKCSHTASQLAYMEAALDYCEIYNPQQVSSLSAQIEKFASQSFPIKLKRKAPESAPATNTNGRNVRVRIN